MKLLQCAIVCLAVSCLVACSEPPPPKKTVFDPMTQQLERARDVQKAVDQNTDATRKAVDSQERGQESDNGDSHP
jgi:hypothetical protein